MSHSRELDPSELPGSRDPRLDRLESQGVTPSQAVSGMSPGTSADWEPPSLETMAALLPQYEFLSLCGRGGMGAVYKVRQRSLNRLAAIKVLPGDLLDDTEANFVERFKNEAQTMGRMNHPCIVNVYDFGEIKGSLLYFAMEYVDGTDVAQMVRSQGHLSPEHALAITAHVCDALDYAHSRGVVHRDIKPANVLINQDGQVKVADFGLAKAPDTIGTSSLTRSDVAMGTPDYVAPEALITGMEVDHRADLYAVGVMLYNMLTGEIPRGNFRDPSRKMGTDPRFDEIIRRAMETDREERYQSAWEIRQALDSILAVPFVQDAPPPSPPDLEDLPSADTNAFSEPLSQIPTSRRATKQSRRTRSRLMPSLLGGAFALVLILFFLLKPSENGASTSTGTSAPTLTGIPPQPQTAPLHANLIPRPDKPTTQEPVPATTATPAPTATSDVSQTWPTPQKVTGDDRKAALLVLSKPGGAMKIQVGQQQKNVQTAADLPSGPFSILDLTLCNKAPHLPPVVYSEADLQTLAGLPQLNRLYMVNATLPPSFMEIFQTMPRLVSLDFNWVKSLNDQNIPLVSGIPTLRTLRIKACANLTNEGVLKLSVLKDLRCLGLNTMEQITPAILPAIEAMKSLDQLEVVGSPHLGGPFLAQLSGLTSLTSINVANFQLSPPVRLDRLKNLNTIHLYSEGGGRALKDDTVESLCTIPGLRSLDLLSLDVTDTHIRLLSRLPELTSLTLSNTKLSPAALSALPSLKVTHIKTLFIDTAFTDEVLLSLIPLKTLKKVSLVPSSPVTPGGLATFQKQRGDVQVIRGK